MTSIVDEPVEQAEQASDEIGEEAAANEEQATEVQKINESVSG